MIRIYEKWATFAGRILLSSAFLFGSTIKIPGTQAFKMTVAYSIPYGLPFPIAAITLAFILEVIAGISLIIGWHTKIAAFLLMLYTILLTLIFHLSFKSPIEIGNFISHLCLIGGLLYVSVYGSEYFAVRKDKLPSA